ncbi:hypothetical protein GCK72_001860 [Caenorhabditis remanei]|uniref:Uncharacterized protein n=1 Tax=Caenorhabditis remanei TaxID=31234 RepID=A0A6A5HUX5_CAERE|nr:hypothetical protein GCK72_001860 [Caenorhabditis remanei]KAF1770043.1 hypothetical protein GCK72_001860 [Caenorhabditis remanei]
MSDDEKNNVEGTTSLFWILLFGIPLFIILFLVLIRKFYHRKRRETNQPTRFKFVENVKPESTWQYEYEGNVVVRCERIRGFRRFLRSCFPFPELGMWRLRDLMIDLYGQKFGGNPRFQVPDEVMTIAIPKNNFRVKGEFSTEFEPKDGVQGDYTYEMYSSSVQITWFHFEGAKYLAGICIYMDNRYNPLKIIKENVKNAINDLRIYKPNPLNFKEKLMKKMWCSFRNQWIIITQNEFGEVDKFIFNGKENQMELVKCDDCSFEMNAKIIGQSPVSKKNLKPLPTLDFSKFLKVEFCEKANDLMMIGKDSNGRIAHFEWDSEIGKFKIHSCWDCDVNARSRFQSNDELNDSPPSYEFLELIELTEN